MTELRRPYTIPQDEVMGFLAPKVRRGRPKYTEEQRQEAQALYRKGGYTHKSLGKLLGISKSTIHKMVNGG